MIILCFFLPFVGVKCVATGTNLVTMSGLDLVTGTTVSTPDLEGLGGLEGLPTTQPSATEDQWVDPELFAILALALAVVGLIVALFRGRPFRLLAAAAGALGAVSLIALQIKVTSDFQEGGQGLIQASYELGYWLSLVLFIAAAVVFALIFTRTPVPER